MKMCCSHTNNNNNNNNEIFIENGSFGTCYSISAIIENNQKIESLERILVKYSSLEQKWMKRRLTKSFHNNYNDFLYCFCDDEKYPAIGDNVYI